MGQTSLEQARGLRMLSFHKPRFDKTFNQYFAHHIRRQVQRQAPNGGKGIGYNIRIVQELLGHDDVETTEIYRHILANRLQNVRSPADMLGKNGFMKPGLALADLPPALEKRFRETVVNQYKGNAQAMLAGLLDLHEKYGPVAANVMAKNVY